MKKHFLTGLAILLPLALTFALIVYFLNLLTEPFVDVVKMILDYFHIFENGFWFLSAAQVQKYVSQCLILTFLFCFTVLLGYITQWFFVHYLIGMGQSLLQRIPFVKGVYKTLQDVTQTIFADKTSSFKQVVLAPFPYPEVYSIGFLTQDSLKGAEMDERVAVFVPTAPNPTSGFLVMIKSSELVYLDMKVEDGLKSVVSCGVIMGDFFRK